MPLSTYNTHMTDTGSNRTQSTVRSPQAMQNYAYEAASAKAAYDNAQKDIAKYSNDSSSKTTSSTPTTQAVSSGGGGGGYSAPSIDYMSILNQIQAQANAAYNAAKSSLDDTLNKTLAGLLDSYNAQKGSLEEQYGNSKTTLDDNNSDALRQAYINKMINARDMGQLMSAQGLTGGQTETTLANMLNNYANNRNAINKTYATNLRELLANHNSNLADALTGYNDKVANARQSYSNYLAQLEQNRANALVSAMPSFSSLLSLLG